MASTQVELRNPGFGTQTELTADLTRRIRAHWLTLSLLGAIAALAAALRFYRLTGRSLWLDEIFTAKAAHLAGPAEVIAFAKADIDQMPLFYLFTWLLHPWGDGAFVLRLQSAVAGSLAVLAVFVLGRKLLGVRGGVTAALLMSLMPYAVWFSQEARNYALFMLLSTVQMYFAYRAIKQGRWFDWSGLAVASVLNLYNHYLALETTAAIAVYIGGFVLFDLLRGSSNRIRISAALSLAIIAAAAVFVRWRPVLKALYSAASQLILEGRVHRLATAAVAAALVTLLAGVLVVFRRRLGVVQSWLSREPGRRFGSAILTGLVVFVAYVPWLPALRVFLSTPTKGFGRLDVNRGPDLGALANIPAGLGISGLLLVVFSLGLVALGVWVFRGRAAEAALLISWLAIPLTLLLLVVRWAIVDVDLRYFAFLFPAVTLVVAAGVEVICSGAAALARRMRAATLVRFADPVAGTLMVALLVVQAVPALATSYGAPKNDWRTTAQHIAASTSPGSVVMAIGNYSDWVVLCLQYYFREMRSPITVVDGMQVTSDVVDQLAKSAGPTWGVIDYPSAAQQTWLDQATVVKTDFVDVTGTIHVIRTSDSSLSPADQAIQMLHWEIPLEAQLRPSAALLDLRSGHASLGPNLAPGAPGSEWNLPPGAAGGDSVVLTPTASNPELNAYLTLSPPPAGNDFIVTFDHQSESSITSQTVSAIAFDKLDRELAVYPTGSGFACAPSASWTRSYFAFTMPQGTTSLVLVFSADGRGTAAFRSIQLNSISDSS